MSIRLSHSAKSTFLTCGQKYKLHYLERWRPKTMSSALLMGTAIDEALNFLLENKDKPDSLTEAIKIFNMLWEQGENNQRQRVDLPLNPDIKYFKADWSPDLLDKGDWAELFKYESKYFDLRTEVDELAKTTDWIDIPEEKRMVYNYGNWLCVQKKGKLLLEAFNTDILPHIKEVLSVQMNVELPDEDGNIFTGVIDYVARLHDGRVMIMDNKTTSTEYDEDAVKISEQLATYFAILNIFNEDPDHPWKHKIDGAGYSVMSKKIGVIKDKTCEECGHKSQGSHKTCDNTINGKRCNGKWDVVKSFEVKTQFITGEISEKFAETVLENATTVKTCIEAGLFPKNFSACADQFGSPCPFINLCHGNNPKGLVKLEKK